MPGERSRQGCEECRRRRRKCDEQKPNCGPCSAFGRPCKYTLKLVWGASKPRRSSIGQWRAHSTTSTEATVAGPEHGNDGPANASSQQFLSLPQSLPNGVPLPPRYQKLLSYFTEDILASLSCHPAIHEDLCRGLIPVALDSPHLLSACLALSAAGFLSRGLSEVEGIEISRVLGHLQHSGLALLRSALDSRQSNETLLVTCLIWCLADVFACGQGGSSWRIHLQGIKALIDGNRTYQKFGTGSGVSRTSMRHLYLLYLSLQTLPYVPPLDHLGFDGGHGGAVALPPPHETDTPSAAHQSIDGFLGYSEELLHVLQQINAISSTSDAESASCSIPQSDILLGKLAGMIRRDASTPPEISICTSLSTQHGREFLLCHKTFQQATLVHLYRRLYRMPSGSPPIQAAIAEIEDMVSEMTQGRPCHTWVAMAMPLFTLGCEAFAPAQRSFILDKIDKFEACLGSLHVRIIRQALEDIWQARETLGDGDGDLCASQLLDTLQYNIILF